MALGDKLSIKVNTKGGACIAFRDDFGQNTGLQHPQQDAPE
jgi:hypothetical protein